MVQTEEITMVSIPAAQNFVLNLEGWVKAMLTLGEFAIRKVHMENLLLRYQSRVWDLNPVCTNSIESPLSAADFTYSNDCV